jgi:CDP-diacylglycerol pyrophosphatase
MPEASEKGTANPALRRRRRLVCVALVFAGLCVATSADALESRDLLWERIGCLDPARVANGDACTTPRADGVDNRDAACRQTTQVWAQSARFVAIRDRRMCNCPNGFVHGLAMPFARITGIEADNLQEGIWQFAWDAAHTRISDEDTIALVVNPPAQRTQDQLHIHLVRRRAGACESFQAGATVSVPNLDHVWKIAKTRAHDRGFTNYGLLVTRCSPQGFTVLIEEVAANATTGPENRYAQGDCR